MMPPLVGFFSQLFYSYTWMGRFLSDVGEGRSSFSKEFFLNATKKAHKANDAPSSLNECMNVI